MFSFGRKKKQSELEDAANMEAMIISCDLTGDFGLKEEQERAFDLEDSVVSRLASLKGVVVDGHEFGDGKFNIYIYALKIQEVFDYLMPVLKSSDLKPIRYMLRFGSVYDKNAPEVRNRIA